MMMPLRHIDSDMTDMLGKRVLFVSCVCDPSEMFALMLVDFTLQGWWSQGTELCAQQHCLMPSVMVAGCRCLEGQETLINL